jgi:hypothetical protein
LLVVGGSSKMHFIKSLLEEITEKEPKNEENEDTCIAHGAALFGAFMVAGLPVHGASVLTYDCTGKALGVRTVSPASGAVGTAGYRPLVEEFSELIAAYSSLPTDWCKKSYYTPDDSGHLKIQVLQKDSWQTFAEAQAVGHVSIADTWKEGAKGTRAHGAQRQALAAGTSEGPAHLRPPGGTKIQIRMKLDGENKLVLKVLKVQDNQLVVIGGDGNEGTVVMFTGYGMPPPELMRYVAGDVAATPRRAAPPPPPAPPPGLAAKARLRTR